MRFFKSLFKTIFIFIILIVIYVIGVNSTGEFKDLFSLKNGYVFTKTETESADDIAIEETEAYIEAKQLFVEEPVAQSFNIVSDTKKQIRHTYISAESQNFEKDIDSIKGRINALNGIIDNSSMSLGNRYNKNSRRSATFSIRIPKNSFDSFINYIQLILNITYKSESVEDVTDNYETIQNKKESLLLEEEKLNQWVKDAKNLDDLLKIEEKLSSVRSELQDIEKSINNMDKVIDYSTCDLSIEEVIVLSENVDNELPKDLKKVAIQGLKDNFEHTKLFLINVALYVFTHLPAMGVLVAVLAIMVLIIFFMRLLIFGTKKIREERLEKRIIREREREEKRIQKEEKKKIREDEKRQEKENLRKLKEEMKYNKKFENEEKKNLVEVEKQIKVENENKDTNYAMELRKRQEEKRLKQEERKKQEAIENEKEQEEKVEKEQIEEKVEKEQKEEKENEQKDVYDAFKSVDSSNEVDLDFEQNKE